jgi:2-polyprenyl-6-methoxyphenol 4-hydroxylase
MNYDIVIVGGAMTGTTLALALSAFTNGKMKIAVLERQPVKQHRQSGFDARCIALSDGSCQKFARIILPDGQNLWQKIQPFSTHIEQIHVSDKGHSGIVEFSAREFHLQQLGAVIELQQVGQILLQAIEQTDNIDYLCLVEIAHIECSQDGVKISLKNDRTLTAQLLIGADGTRSEVASAVNISQEMLHDYGQTAIIANVQIQQPHQNRAFERFTTEGPLALLPMKDNLMSLVWCVRHADELLQADENSFLTRLQQQFGWRLGRFQRCGQRFAYPLTLSRAAQHVQARTVLIGNAAQTLHPIAGQGFNLGIRDVMTLANILSYAYLQQQEIGYDALLQQYENKRKADQKRMIQLTDGLLTIFANNLLPLQIGRNLGLMALAQSSMLRQYFAKPTLGWI